MEHLFANLIHLMNGVPLPAVYVIVAVWIGAESIGIGWPIEPMMLFAGSLAAQSAADNAVELVLFIAATAVGCLLFASLAYWLGNRLGTAAITRAGRFVGLTQTRADHIELWLRRRGLAGVVVARLTPVVRTYGSFIMGAADLPVWQFVTGTLAGSALYTSIWMMTGDALGANYAQALGYLDRIGAPGFAAVAVVVVVIVTAHHFAGRHELSRIARHYRKHAGTKVPAATLAR